MQTDKPQQRHHQQQQSQDQSTFGVHFAKGAIGADAAGTDVTKKMTYEQIKIMQQQQQALSL
ncbi:MAG: hypothetical protein A3B66_07440 [Alphaproteobacteria bacterium RIFCSPHIGHO2_02_FULL_46_13]|nr:MAG: hypothetical protein A3B66_07440 [Alphaproteobacteria bacterium RIFCSPHIGHO2_02_FULL_46_13]